MSVARRLFAPECLPSLARDAVFIIRRLIEHADWAHLVLMCQTGVLFRLSNAENVRAFSGAVGVRDVPWESVGVDLSLSVIDLVLTDGVREEWSRLQHLATRAVRKHLILVDGPGMKMRDTLSRSAPACVVRQVMGVWS